MAEGEARTIEDVPVWGSHRPGLVRDHGRVQPVPRVVDGPEAYGHAWNGTELANGSFEIQPSEADRGRELAIGDWCNERFCLFTSELVNWTDTHLVVEHGAEAGQRVHAGSLDTDLSVVDAGPETFTVDGNDPRAGQNYTVYAHIADLRGPSEGETRAPSFNLTTLEGGSVSLAQFHGKPVVVEFFATWCPSCRENADHLADVREAVGDDVAIVSIGVDPWESSTSLRSFVEEHNVTWPVAVDEQGEVADAYSVGTLSTEVIVGPEGVIRHVETGVADHDRVVAVLEDLLASHDHHGHDHGAQP
jgi:peroxiredoxin